MNIHRLWSWGGHALLAVLLTAAALPHATGATVTYNSSSCTGFVLSGTPPNQVITCTVGGGGGGVPVCSPTANPASPSVGQETTISANCSNSPNPRSYVWNGGGCGRVRGATCIVEATQPASTTFTVKATNSSGTGAAASITITWQ